ncbi:methyltransferase [Gracilaria domingensis]|nr:methyltransferase [Gracilaria domingensis]
MANISFDETFTEDEYIRAIQYDFTKRAPEYNSGLSGEQHRQTIQTLLELYPPEYPLLDVACGTGLLAEQLSRQGEGVTGLDLTEAMLQKARILSPRGTFVQGRAESLPFDDCTFACAYCCSALVYFTDIPAVVREIYRVVNHGGFFAYQAVTLDSYVNGVELERAIEQVLGPQRAKNVFQLPHAITHDEQANRKLMSDAGFVDVQTKMIVTRYSLDVAKLERFWDAVVGRNAMMGKLRTLSQEENKRIRDRWVQLIEERRDAEGLVPDIIESWYVCGRKP